jgi:hypothetical protein
VNRVDSIHRAGIFLGEGEISTREEGEENDKQSDHAGNPNRGSAARRRIGPWVNKPLSGGVRTTFTNLGSSQFTPRHYAHFWENRTECQANVEKLRLETFRFRRPDLLLDFLVASSPGSRIPICQTGFVWQSKIMTSPQDAAGQLQTIRMLMERATVYRAISLPAALLGGLLALPAAWFASTGGNMRFLSVWLAALCVTGCFNTWQLWRQARRENRAFLSSGLRLALRALVPPLLAGGVVGGQLAFHDHLLPCAATWVLCYGLALLASREFAPRSIVRLGTAFFAAGLLSFLLLTSIPVLAALTPANVLMATTFGLLHLVYAAAISLSASRRE